jgi:hypothetical protein
MNLELAERLEEEEGVKQENKPARPKRGQVGQAETGQQFYPTPLLSGRGPVKTSGGHRSGDVRKEKIKTEQLGLPQVAAYHWRKFCDAGFRLGLRPCQHVRQALRGAAR